MLRSFNVTNNAPATVPSGSKLETEQQEDQVAMVAMAVVCTCLCKCVLAGHTALFKPASCYRGVGCCCTRGPTTAIDGERETQVWKTRGRDRDACALFTPCLSIPFMQDRIVVRLDVQ